MKATPKRSIFREAISQVTVDIPFWEFLSEKALKALPCLTPYVTHV
jgi:hypothetical protein